MNQSRAFSDTEIITIATVAAAALGGIVVGLGRGQDDDEPVEVGRSHVEDAVGRVREAGASLIATVPEKSPSIDFRSVASNLVDSYKDAQSDGSSFLHRAADKIAPMLSLDQVVDRLPVDSSTVNRSTFEHLAARGREAIRTNAPDLASRANVSDKIDASGITDRIRNRVDSHRADSSSSGVVSHISDELSAVEDAVASAPDKVQAAKQQSASLVRRKVADPVSSAASTTKDATLDSLAALAWLGAGAAVVYFGLLSSERREQVKSVLCGTIEQGRLLLLDFQGYEPEM